jgi:flagellar motor protein MotB
MSSRSNRQLRIWPSLCAAACFSALLAACGSAPSTSRAVVIAASATRNEPRPVLAPPDLALLHGAADSSNGVAYIVNPNSGQAVAVPLTPRRPDGQIDYGPARAALQAESVTRVQRLLGREAADKPFDLLSMIAAATRVVSRPGTLIVLSSGLSTAGPFNLTHVGWDTNPRAVAVELKRAGLLPDLSGWNVDFSGLADTAGDQPALPLPQRAELAGYWMAICAASLAKSCVVDGITRPSSPSLSDKPVPVVAIPRIYPIRASGSAAGIAAPADEFFAFGSALLLDGADRILAPLAAEARTHRMNVSIVGYASPDGGTSAFNAVLSERRAMAIRSRLISLGVPPKQIIQAIGLGTAGISKAACYLHGHLDEGICKGLRRVVILLSPTQTTPA